MPTTARTPGKLFLRVCCKQSATHWADQVAFQQKPLSHKKKKSHKKRVPDSHEREEAINGTKRVREDSQTAPGDQEAESQIGRDAKRRREESPLNGMPHASSRTEPSQVSLLTISFFHVIEHLFLNDTACSRRQSKSPRKNHRLRLPGRLFRQSLLKNKEIRSPARPHHVTIQTSSLWRQLWRNVSRERSERFR